MRKVSLNQTLDSAFSISDSNLAELKSAMIGLCADIERYFKVAFDVSLNEEIDDESFRRILYVLPRFGSLNIDQFNRFVILFVNIRGVSAHLYASKPIFVDEDIENFITSNVELEYQISSDRKITVYGAVLILAMMAQKYMIWPFCTSFFRFEYFNGIGKGEEMSDFQINQQRILNSICGNGKPLTQNAEPTKGIEATFINEVLKKCLTLVFFDLERVLNNNNGCCKIKAHSLSFLLKNHPLFSEEIVSKIRRLRNCWFHGSFIGDIVDYEGTTFEFTLEFAVETLKQIAEVVEKDMLHFGLIINDINYFGQNFFNYYALRVIEVSYKILDKRLLTEDKFEERLKNADNAYLRFSNVEPKVYEMFADLINYDTLRWKIGAAKFLDKFPRKFDCDNLKIVKIHCDEGFKIGDFRTDRKDIVLANVDLDDENINLVNDLKLCDMKMDVEKKYSKFITVVKTTI